MCANGLLSFFKRLFSSYNNNDDFYNDVNSEFEYQWYIDDDDYFLSSNLHSDKPTTISLPVSPITLPLIMPEKRYNSSSDELKSGSKEQAL